MGKLFFIGDSITAGAWDNRGGWVARLIGEIMQLNIQAQEKNDVFNCLPYNIGVSGDTFPDAMGHIKPEIQWRLYDEPEETIQFIISLGLNDSVYMVNENRPLFTDKEFRSNVMDLINLCREFSNNISFIGLSPVDDELLNPIPWAPEKAYGQKWVKPYEDIIQEICIKEKLAFWPMFERWMQLDDYRKYLLDGAHPNSKGHEWMAEQIRPFIITEDFLKYHK